MVNYLQLDKTEMEWNLLDLMGEYIRFVAFVVISVAKFMSLREGENFFMVEFILQKQVPT